MAKYEQIAESLRGMIRQRRLKPGDVLPSDRALARQFGVSCGAVRMAHAVLLREGLIVRRHGSGTSVAPMASHSPGRKSTRRLGMIYVDLPDEVFGYSQRLTLAAQKCAHERGYELLIEQMRTHDLIAGKVPAMIARRSVDAVLLDGWTTEAHCRFLQNHAMPYVSLGVRPLGASVPQVRPNVYRLLREITRELILAGRGPIWLVGDSAGRPNYPFGDEIVRGYTDELYQHGRYDVRLCPMPLYGIAGAIGRLMESDLSHAALIVRGWAWSLLAESLIARAPEAKGMLFTSLAARLPPEIRPECRYVRWTQALDENLTARPAVTDLVDVLEGRSATFQSVSVESSCRILDKGEPVRGEAKFTEMRSGPRFRLEWSGTGAVWRMESDEAQANGRPELAGERNQI